MTGGAVFGWFGCAITVVGFGVVTFGPESPPNIDMDSQPERPTPMAATARLVQTIRATRDEADAINEEVTGKCPLYGTRMSEDPEISGHDSRSKSDGRLRCGLYLVATPIGNSRDITLRALEILATADKLYAEDTRVTSKLLAMHAISRSMHSYREQNARHTEEQILRNLEDGMSVALVSDAGSPLVSDPGESLVAAVTSRNFPVYPIPGPSAVIAALTASGLPSDRFFFAGFLAPKSNERRRMIRELDSIPATLIFYEAPPRLIECLEDLHAILGNREAAVARELTKLHEEIVRRPLDALIELYRQRPDIRGEIAIVVSPPGTAAVSTDEGELDRKLMQMLQEHPVKDAAAIVAAELGLPRRTVYARALVLKKSDEG
jgi:16S rRNA (cytidine1402-2'-O)-methyltransferase